MDEQQRGCLCRCIYASHVCTLNGLWDAFNVLCSILFHLNKLWYGTISPVEFWDYPVCPGLDVHVPIRSERLLANDFHWAQSLWKTENKCWVVTTSEGVGLIVGSAPPPIPKHFSLCYKEIYDAPWWLYTLLAGTIKYKGKYRQIDSFHIYTLWTSNIAPSGILMTLYSTRFWNVSVGI